MNILKPLLSIYFFIFIFIFMLYYIIKIYKRREILPTDILKMLDTFKIDNLLLEIFFILLYFILNFLIFLYIRIIFLHEKKIGIDYLNSLLSLAKIVDIFFIIFSIILYLKILELLFYKSIIKVHIFFNKYQKYNEMTDIIISYSAFISRKFNKFCIIFWRYTLPENSIKRHILSIVQRQKMDFTLKINDFPPEYYYNDIKYKIWKIVNNNIILYYFCRLFWLMESNLNCTANISKMLSFVPGYLCFFLLIYDLYNNEIYFFQYGLLLLLLLNFIKKFRYFYERKFSVFDKTMANYLYFEKGMIIHEEKVDNKADLYEYLYYDSEEIKRYIYNDFTRDILIELRDDIYRGNNRSKRLLLIFLVIISTIFFYTTNKYFLIIKDNSINMYILTLMLVIILYLIHRKINVYYKEIDDFRENLFYKRLFRIIVILLCMPIIYIILKNRLTVDPSATIIDIEGIIKIVEILK